MKKRIIKEFDMLVLLEKFISDCQRKKRLQKNGKIITPGTIQKYIGLHGLLKKFSNERQFPLRIRSVEHLHKRELKTERNYYKKFYKKFTDYCYEELDHFDNTVCGNIKSLRAFFNYINLEYLINTAGFQKLFYAHAEEIEVIVLSPERLNYLIQSKGMEEKLKPRLKIMKDIFVFGCTVALRVSDLMNLSPKNIEWINETAYLNVLSQKTHTFTRVRLPQYAVNILRKYIRRKRQRIIFPYYHKVYLNLYIKEILEIAGFTEEREKKRQKRGQPIIIYKDKEKKTHFQFCDLVTAHTMRRTAITTMLSLGMKEDMVRKISGHAPTSREFYRYVGYSQAYLDNEIEKVHEKLSQKILIRG